MLRSLLQELRDPHDSGPSLLAGALGLLLGIALGALILGAKDAPTATETAERGEKDKPIDLLKDSDAPARDDPPADSDGAEITEARVKRVLEDARRQAEAFGGTAEVAIWIDGAAGPVAAGSTGAIRMWSISKPVVALALLEESDGKLTPGLQVAMQDAITKSDNCAVRLLTLELQRRTGGPDGARVAFNDVLGAAGARASPVLQQKAADPICHSYLRKHGEPGDPGTEAVFFGTAEWTIRDAVAFGRALARRTYGDHGQTILDFMRDTKAPSPNAGREEFTADPMFGAGIALDHWKPAYKGGWGGSQIAERFMVGQLVTLDAVPRKVAIAAMFHPREEPPIDDPGLLRSPEALEAIFELIDVRLLEELER